MKRTGTWLDPRIDQVRVAQIRSYLLAHGWRQENGPDSPLLVFGGPVDDNGKLIELVVPASEKFPDYSDYLDVVIRALSILEDRHCLEVLEDILSTTPAQKPAVTANGADGDGPAKEPTKRKRR
jgi:hypothetical protein